MIVDSHQHLGRSILSGVSTSKEEVLEVMRQNNVDVALVMPQPTRDDLREYHDRIASAVETSQGRLFGLASIDPWWNELDYATEARRCIDELKFVGLKLHPLAHGIASNHAIAEKVFRNAAELAVPVIVHTGLGTPWSLPSLCISPARKYPELPIVLAHAGWGVYCSEAIVAAEVCDNIHLEASWCPTYEVRNMIDRIGCERVLFGSDHLSNLPVELTKYRSIALSDEDLSLVLGENAKRLFRLPC